MSFFENSINELGNPLDMLIRRPGGDKRLLPKRLVLSSSIEFVFIDPVDKKEILLFQADSINKTKRFTEKKNFKPFGHSHNIVLTRDDGWDIRITGKKTDTILNAVIYYQEDYLSGTSAISPGTSNKPVGLKPQFDIRERVSYLPNSKGEASIIEQYLYKDVSIVAFEESFESDAAPALFSITCFCARREIINAPEEVLEVSNSITNIINSMLKFNKQ